MKNFFRPAVALMNRLGYPKKFILLGAISAIVISILTIELIKQSIAIMDFSKKELFGIAYINPLIEVMNNLQNIRKFENEFQLGIQSNYESLNALQADVDHSFTLLDTKDKNLGTMLSTTPQLNALKSDWLALKSSIANESKLSHFNAFSNLIENIKTLIVTVCDTSNLTLDPDIYTYYLMDTYCTKIPNFSEQTAVMRDLGVQVLATKNLTPLIHQQLIINKTLMDKFNKIGIKNNFNKVIAEKPDLSTKFDATIQSLMTQATAVTQLLDNGLLNNNLTMTISNYSDNFSKLLSLSKKLARDTSQSLDQLVQVRVHKIQFALYMNIIIATIGLLATIYLFAGFYLSVMTSIKTLIQASEKLAQGDLTTTITLETQDELLRVASSFNTMRDSLSNMIADLQTVINDTTHVLNSLSKGDLTQKITKEYKGAFSDLKVYVNMTVDSLEKLISNIKFATKTIHHEATEIAKGNNDLAKRTTQQAAFLEETSASIEQVTATIKQNAENAKQANQLAQSASDVATRGGTVVNEVVHTMTAINESSNKVTDIISVIDNIAFQTNILALNAAVEAARAGEQGRGFAVVATEVRNLAQRTSAAAKEINSLISKSVENVTSGTKLVDQAGQTMEEIVKAVNRVTDIMSDIANASEEQSKGIEQVNEAVVQMDHVTQQNSAMVEKAAEAAESMENQTTHMNKLVNQFKLKSQSKYISDLINTSLSEEEQVREKLDMKKDKSDLDSDTIKRRKDIWQEF